MKMTRVLSVLCLIAAVALGGTSCQQATNNKTAKNSAKDKKTHVFLLGVDGLDVTIVDEMISNGRLPNLKKLRGTSAYGTIYDNDLFYLSPVVWTTIATGRDQRAHGIRDFRKFENGKPRMYNATDLKAPTVWEIVGANGLKSYVVGWFTSRYSSVENSVILSDRLVATCKPDPADLYPVDFELNDVYKICLNGYSIEDIPEVLSITADEFVRFSPADRKALQGFVSVVRRDDFYAAATLEILEKKPDFDLFAIYLRSPDGAGHVSMRYVDSSIKGTDPYVSSVMVEGFHRTYDYIDRKIGEIMDVVGEDDYLILLSDHGFGTSVYTDYGPVKPGPYFDHDLLVELMGFMPFTKKCPRRMIVEETRLFKNGMMDSEKYKPLVSFDGYDEYAPVPGKENEIIEDFLKVASTIETMNGVKLFSNIGELQQSRPWENGSPAVLKFNDINADDILRFPERNHTVKQMLRTRPAALYHRFPGSFMIKGPGVKVGELEKQASYYSITPTVLYLLGQPVPKNMDGEVMQWLFSPEFTKDRDVIQGPIVHKKEVDNALIEKIRKDDVQEFQELKDLGYIQ